MWYLDSHHQTLSERSCHVPAIFNSFVGFNVPKRSIESFSREVLKSHTQRLFGNLQCHFWSRSGWNTLRTDVELLANSISTYADLQGAKKAKVNSLHKYNVPARVISEALSVQYINPCHSAPSDPVGISSASIF